MSVCVCLLRGVNVGGRNRLAMADLRGILGGLGARDVRTYIQSGNAVFRGAVSASDLTQAIAAHCGFAPHCLTLPLEDYEARLAAIPFPEVAEAALADTKILHAFFLKGPSKPLGPALLALAAPGERVEMTRGGAWLHAPDGIGRSKLAGRLEKALGVSATARNWKSACAIRDLARELAA